MSSCVLDAPSRLLIEEKPTHLGLRKVLQSFVAMYSVWLLRTRIDIRSKDPILGL